MKRISIDLGSGTTKIYIPGCGVVLTEATCVAVEEYTENGEKTVGIKAFGDKARALSGRAAVNTRIVNPVWEGDIVQEGLASLLLEYFLNKIEITRKKARRTEAVFILPCGAKAEVKQKYKRIAEDCGIASVYFTLAPFAAILGHNVAISESTPMFCIDIGNTVTNIAALSQDGIVSGLSINLGGVNVDRAIMDEIYEKNNLKIGAPTAEKLKITVGSLLEDDNKMTVVEGRNVDTGEPSSVAVASGQIYGVISDFAEQVLKYAKIVLTKLPAEVASGVMHGGIYLSGGLLKIDGFPEFIESRLNIPVNMPEETQLAAVIGGGAVISDDGLLYRLATVD